MKPDEPRSSTEEGAGTPAPQPVPAGALDWPAAHRELPQLSSKSGGGVPALWCLLLCLYLPEALLWAPVLHKPREFFPLVIMSPVIPPTLTIARLAGQERNVLWPYVAAAFLLAALLVGASSLAGRASRVTKGALLFALGSMLVAYSFFSWWVVNLATLD
jgi:hypothetical protein